jgi:hypothetical protein
MRLSWQDLELKVIRITLQVFVVWGQGEGSGCRGEIRRMMKQDWVWDLEFWGSLGGVGLLIRVGGTKNN